MKKIFENLKNIQVLSKSNVVSYRDIEVFSIEVGLIEKIGCSLREVYYCVSFFIIDVIAFLLVDLTISGLCARIDAIKARRDTTDEENVELQYELDDKETEIIRLKMQLDDNEKKGHR